MAIHIAFASDRNFLTCTSVTIASILHYHPSDICFYILHEDLSSNDLKSLYHVINHNGKKCELIPLNVGRENWEGFPTTRTLPRSTYFRLNLPRMLPGLEKVIYMDGDILVLDDIAEVWEMPVENYALAAMSVHSLSSPFQELVGRNTFNAGFLLFNLSYILKTNGIQRLQKNVERYRERLALFDQDLLNLTFCDEHLKLPLRWNITTGALAREDENYRTIPEEEYEDAIRHPAVIHFTTRSKPWKFNGKRRHPFETLYPYFANLANAPFFFRFLLFLKYGLGLNRRFHYTDAMLSNLPIIYETINKIKKS